MAKYDPLRNHLTLTGKHRITMSFEEIANLVGELPRSAWDHRAWWGNNDQNVEAAAWLDAGYRVTSVDQTRGIVVFTRAN